MINRKRLGRALIEAWYDYAPAEFDTATIKKAVIFIPKSIGDGMGVYPAIRALQAHGVEWLGIVTSTRSAPIYETLKDEGAEIFIVPHDRDYRAVRKIARQIRRDHGPIDLCVEGTALATSPANYFVGTLKARMNLQLSGSRMRCYAPLSARAVEMFFERELPVPWCWAALMRDAGIAEVEGRFELPLPAGVEVQAESWLDGLDEFVVLNLDGSTPDKWLSLDRAEMVARHLEQRYGLPILVICSPSGEAKAAELSQRLKYATLPALPRTIHHSAALIARAALVVTPDTSVVHIASAYDRPVIGIYRAPNGHWIPLSTKSAVIITDGEVDKLSGSALIQAMDKIGQLAPARDVTTVSAACLGPET